MRNLLSNAFDAAVSVGKAAGQYMKDVVTGKKLMQGLNDGGKFFDGWIAHGASELYNVMWKGEVAPMYSHSRAPPINGQEIGPPNVEQPDVANELMDAVKAQAKAHYQVDKMELSHMEIDNHISIDQPDITAPVDNNISMDVGVDPPVMDNQISMDDMQIDVGGVEVSEPITPPHPEMEI
ncbi:MAG: hypothetical protein KDB27_02555 [Planctomycetales bacterium]|nr:hypothetical protein [Planctomycetales bacterium]